MRPISSQPLGKTAVGGSRWNPAAAALLLSLCLGFPPSLAPCPPCCLCASDIISCSGCNLSMLPSDLPGYATRLDLSHNTLTVLPVDWISRPFDRLATLVLSRNSISRIEVDAFTVTPHLLHLDISSNRLTALNSSIFAGLEELKELLLFGNQIVQINPGAFSDLYSLQRLYFSGNRLTAFPLGLYWEPGGPRNLTFLDLSYNRLSEVPVQSLLSLTRHCAIYLQKNPLVCDCALLALLEYWMWKQYRPLVDFRGEYPCRDGSGPEYECSQEVVSDMPLEAQTYQVEPGKWLRVPCPGLATQGQEGLALFWVTPRTVVNSSTDDPMAHLIVSPNGTLEIRGALMEDSGMYWCVAARGRHYAPDESLEVNVVVGNLSTASTGGSARGSGAEHFNTAFTTLASCVVSIILVLLYLYLTPCRCRENRGGRSRGCGGRAFILCSDPREVESGQRRSNGKRVAFLEPQVEASDIGGPKTPAMNLGHVTTEGILKNGSRTVGQTLTDTAHIAETRK
ncbi:amphoterin-induced protein 2-like [Lycodopsis pacificus]